MYIHAYKINISIHTYIHIKVDTSAAGAIATALKVADPPTLICVYACVHVCVHADISKTSLEIADPPASNTCAASDTELSTSSVISSAYASSIALAASATGAIRLSIPAKTSIEEATFPLPPPGRSPGPFRGVETPRLVVSSTLFFAGREKRRLVRRPGMKVQLSLWGLSRISASDRFASLGCVWTARQ